MWERFYFLNGSKNCMVATYNFGSVYFFDIIAPYWNKTNNVHVKQYLIR